MKKTILIFSILLSGYFASAQTDTTNVESNKDANNDADTSNRVINRSFIYSIGTNFDFIDNIKVDKTYHDLKVSLPDINNTRWGLFFKLNRFRTFSSPDSLSYILKTTEGRQIIVDNDTTFAPTYIDNTVKEKFSRKIDNYGIFLAPTLRLASSSKKSNDNNSNEDNVNNTLTKMDAAKLKPSESEYYIGLFPSFEWQRSVFITDVTREFSATRSDTVPSNWTAPYNTVQQLPEESVHSKIMTDNFFYGLGFTFSFKNEVGILNAKVSGGLAKINQIDGSFTSNLPALSKRGWADVAIEIVEPYETGIKIGAELRGFFNNDPNDQFQNMARFNLYIAKEFNLKKIGELLKP